MAWLDVQTAVDMTIQAHERAVCIPENCHAAHLPLHTRPAGRARISLLSQVTSLKSTIQHLHSFGKRKNLTVKEKYHALTLEGVVFVRNG